MSKPQIASLSPYAVEVEKGQEYFWCRCGRSDRQPFCDGSHRGSGLEPARYQADRSGTVWFCGCKQTANAPLCDGTHKRLGEE
ncbi:MAG: CDGSH iron-sulfur domain-containing protein [Gammaproteobacteria bacterium]|jgi:CDGSH-type Zn-finger protein|nr:MAG: CDGSH iron-sulfur domain-containing protein [Gammaproteobacteria bacterium]